MASRAATAGPKSLTAAKSPDRRPSACLSWDPEADSVLIYLGDSAPSDTNVEDGGVIVQRDATGATVILEILCVHQGVSASAMATVAQHFPPAGTALAQLVKNLPLTCQQIDI